MRSFRRRWQKSGEAIAPLRDGQTSRSRKWRFHQAGVPGLLSEQNLLSVSTPCEGLSKESQAGLPDLQGVGAELADQAEKRLCREKPQALSVPEATNDVWSLDFMDDQLVERRPFGLLNVIDDFNREVLGIEADFSLPAERLIRMLEQIISWRGKPNVIRCDNGPEHVSGAVQTWTSRQGIRIE